LTRFIDANRYPLRSKTLRKARSAQAKNACAPDIGHGPDWQGKAALSIAFSSEVGTGSREENASNQRLNSATPAGQETAPAAGLGLGRADLLGKFIAWGFVV